MPRALSRFVGGGARLVDDDRAVPGQIVYSGDLCDILDRSMDSQKRRPMDRIHLFHNVNSEPVRLRCARRGDRGQTIEDEYPKGRNRRYGKGCRIPTDGLRVVGLYCIGLVLSDMAGVEWTADI